MHYFFADGFDGSSFIISDRDSVNHAKVLRLGIKEEVMVSHNGQVFLCTVCEQGKSILLQKIRKLDIRPDRIRITLYQSLPKKKKFENILEKATETGVVNFIPVNSEHVQQVYKEKKEERFRKILKNAAMQSRRLDIPQLFDLTEIGDINAESELRLILHPYKGSEHLSDIIRRNPDISSVDIAIGPEGGFSDRDINTLKKKGFIPAAVPCGIMRTENAAMCTASILKYEYEDLSDNQFRL
ncbi:MAG: RsmE family RNA methyltransferase [Candidatus Muiribacteriaceae bacterium]